MLFVNIGGGWNSHRGHSLAIFVSNELIVSHSIAYQANFDNLKFYLHFARRSSF